MLFNETLKALIDGKFARRNGWTAQDGYLVLLPGMPLIWKILTTPQPNAGGYPLLVADLLADDWEVSDPCHDSKVLVKQIVEDMQDAA